MLLRLPGFLALLLVAVAGCSGGEPVPAPINRVPNPVPAPPPVVDPGDEDLPMPPAANPAGYAGPPVHAVFQPARPGGALQLELTVPTGGYQLRQDLVLRTGGDAAVRLFLEAPASNEMVTQALATLRHEVPWATLASVGDFAAVRIEVAQIQSGVHYLVAPEFLLARRVPAPR